MAEITLVRIDSRMIHGQVCTSWLGATKSNRIVLIDDELVADPLMSQVLTYAAPSNVSLALKSTDDAAKEFEENKFGDGRVLILFQNIKNAHKAYFKGFKYNELQVGGVEGGKPGKKVVHENISIDEDEAKLLKEVEDAGCSVVFQQLPFSAKNTLSAVLKKYYPQCL